MFSDTFGHRHCAGEQSLLVVAEDLLHREIVGGGSESADAGGHHDDILLTRVNSFERPAQVSQRVVVAHRHQYVTAANVEGGTFHRIALEELELVFHRLLCQRGFSIVHAFGNGEDYEEDDRKRYSSNRGDRFREQVHDGGCEQHQEYGSQANRDLVSANRDIGRNLPSALTVVLETQNQHGQAVERETPDHAESVSFAEDVDISAAG